MKNSVCDVLREKMIAYIESRNVSVRWLSQRVSLPYSLVYGIINNETHYCRFWNAYQILKVVAPGEVKKILVDHFHIYSSTIDHDKNFVENASKLDKALDLTLQTKMLYLVHSMASTTLGTTRNEVKETFGHGGIEALDLLLQEEILGEQSDGTVTDLLFETINSNEDHLLQMVRYNLESFHATDKHSFIFNIVEGFSDQGAQDVLAILKETWSKMWEILHDPSKLGSNRLFLSVICSDMNKGTGQDFETRVNNYKKALELDDSTAKKVAMIAHDMRGPLGYIQDYMDKVSAMNRSEDELRLAKSAMKRINSMVNSFKDLNSSAIVTRGKGWLYFDECRDLAESYSHQYSKDFEFIGSLEFDADLDAEKVDRALQNLITNAFDAARSAVRVEIFRQESELVMIVRDNGPGVPEQSRPRLFQKGFTEGKDNGTGIGLAFVKHVADGHGGSIDYKRSNEGWTIFKLTIPHVFFDDLLESEISRLDVEERFLEPEVEEEEDEQVLKKTPLVEEDPDKKRRLLEIAKHKPILLILVDSPYWCREKQKKLAQLLPEYEISDSYEDVERAWLTCLSSDDSYYDYIMAHRLNSVWMPSRSHLTSPALVETLQGMGLYELKKFQTMKHRILLDQDAKG